ncbi:MAG: glycosyltransferase family 4 protein [Colwellia sp.]
MNIAIVTTWFERGAAYVSKQYEELLSSEHEVFIYARGGESYAINDPKWDADNVHWGKKYPMPNKATYIDEKDFVDWLLKLDIEVVLFNEQHWWQPILTCKKMGIKTGAYIDYYTENTIKLFSLYDFLICNTLKHFSAFSWHKQCYYVPWGTDIDLFKPSQEQLEENKTSLVFFHSAGMNPFRKGTDFVLEAFKIVKERFEHCKLVIHSQVDLKESFPHLANSIDELQKADRLELIERTVTAPGLYYRGDVYIYPSRLEGLGLTVAEALACGLPTITVDNAPMNEFIEKPSRVAKVKNLYCRGDAYYWPMCEVDIPDLALQMEFFACSVDDIAKFKRQSREYALTNLDWNKAAAAVNDAIIKSKVICTESAVEALANKQDNIKYPGITRFPKFYSYIYSISLFIKKNR